MDNTLAVYTIKKIMFEKASILYVVHDVENNWQFLSNEAVSMKDLLMVTVEEVIKIDLTVRDILWLPAGTEAKREAIGGEWTTSVYSD